MTVHVRVTRLIYKMVLHEVIIYDCTELLRRLKIWMELGNGVGFESVLWLSISIILLEKRQREYYF